VNIGQEEEAKTLTLRGVGANVEAELYPNAMTFGQQLVAEQSQSRTITFRNQGSVAFMVSETMLRDNAEDVFTLEKDHCSQQVLQPRDSCSLTFAFAPTDPTTYQSVVQVVDDTGTEIWSVDLTGTGIQLPTPEPVPVRVPVRVPVHTVSSPAPAPAPTLSSRIQVSPNAIAFGEQPLNAPMARTVTVTNTASQPVILDESILSESTMFTQGRDTCSTMRLAPDDSCEIDVVFQARTAGEHSASLIVGDNSGDDLHRVVLGGTGVDAALSPESPLPNMASSGSDSGTNSGSGVTTTRSPKIHAFNANPATELQLTDTTRLCYEITHATQAHMVNEVTGEQIELPTASAGCVPQTPERSTTYTLVATDEANQVVRQRLDVTVVGSPVGSPVESPVELERESEMESDQEPPTVPVAIAPTRGSTVYCTNTARLEWRSATDNEGPITYTVTLQRREAAAAAEDEGVTLVSGAWVNLTTQTTSETQLDLSGLITPPFTYRWRVQAIDAAGHTSQPSAWAQFWCISP
ncbi:MAG: choice-of-anchor D domain-containing protein, partial [Cyanothece sp. SIO2G6]|nr:choice-of-anchor D domain-containing protein [Cyanothece sp. SIO2G6]